MRSRPILCSLVLVVLGWTSPSHATPQSRTNEINFQEKEEIQKTHMESAEVNWRVVAVRQKGVDRCPDVPGWNPVDWLVQALDPQYEPQEEDSYGYRYGHQSRPPKRNLRQIVAGDPLLSQTGLDRFCAYTPRTGQPSGFPTRSLPAGLAKAARSRMALVPAGDPDQEAASILAKHFVDQATGIDPRSPDIEGVAPAGKPVRLVFIDTQPDGEGLPHVSGPSKHGYTLVHLVSRLVCGGIDPCPVELATRLALSHSNKHLPPAFIGDSGGGNLGLVEELAAAIVREVDAWRQSGSKSNLILNLSVGWDDELLENLDNQEGSQLKPDTQLVYDALQYARRSGALVIAAAGNRRGGLKSTGPVLPAAWELYRPSGSLVLFGRKLVYAVGGVDWQDLPLSNFRHGGLPRRVAFGDHATASTDGGYEPTAMYTGSSVSTAVVSAIAARVWQLRPELRPAQVMKLIKRSSYRLPGRADYYFWKHLPLISWLVPAPHLRRLSLCTAVARACAEGGRCGIPACKKDNTAADLSTLAHSDSHLLPTVQPATLPEACEPASDPTPRLFAVDKSDVSPEAGKRLCPLYLLPDIVSQRWVAPQPDDPPCPNCSFVPPPSRAGYVLAIAIDPSWQAGRTIESATLDVDRYFSGRFVERLTYAIPLAELNAVTGPTGTHRLLMSQVADGTLVGCTATLNFQVEVDGNTYSVQNPVYVDP